MFALSATAANTQPSASPTHWIAAALALFALFRTVAADPASDCTLRPPGAWGHFDLGPLRNPKQNYRVEDPKTSSVYLLNFCGPLVQDSDLEKYSCPSNSAACLGHTSESDEGKSIGIANEASLTKIAFMLKYTYYSGDNCPSNPSVKMKTIILLQCQKSQNERLNVPQFLRAQQCEHVFRMMSPAACLVVDSGEDATPKPSVNCKTQDASGRVYDLSPLSRTKTDWFVNDPDPSSDYQWYLNVCHDVNDPPPAKCAAGSGACVTKQKNPTYWRSIGRTSETKLEVDDATGLSLTMDGGDKCDDGTTGKVVIDFICDDLSTDLGNPVYTDDDPSDCSEWRLNGGRSFDLQCFKLTLGDYFTVHQFTWKSHSACPTHAVAQDSPPSSGVSVFWPIFSVALGYFTAGGLYKRFRLGYRGADQIPHIDTFRSLVRKLTGRRRHEYNIVL